MANMVNFSPKHYKKAKHILLKQEGNVTHVCLG